MMGIRAAVVAICALLMFGMTRWQIREKNKPQPRKAVLLLSKILNLVCAALISLAVVGQIITLTGR